MQSFTAKTLQSFRIRDCDRPDGQTVEAHLEHQARNLRAGHKRALFPKWLIEHYTTNREYRAWVALPYVEFEPWMLPLIEETVNNYLIESNSRSLIRIHEDSGRPTFTISNRGYIGEEIPDISEI